MTEKAAIRHTETCDMKSITCVVFSGATKIGGNIKLLRLKFKNLMHVELIVFMFRWVHKRLRAYQMVFIQQRWS
ncbi:hypothetical protein Pfo_011328 [Paulownia fortunei]|nr:hypothetical protein Pfo_011328 [Paulownia fortunei]